MQMITTTAPKYKLSIRFNMFEKRLKGVPAPKDHNEQTEQAGKAGATSHKGWIPADMTMTELFNHCGKGLAIAVSVFRDNYRERNHREETNIFGLDFENGGLSVEDLIIDPLISSVAGLIIPSASDRPEDPRARVYIPLSRSVTEAEYKALYSFFEGVFEGPWTKPAKTLHDFSLGLIRTQNDVT